MLMRGGWGSFRQEDKRASRIESEYELVPSDTSKEKSKLVTKLSGRQKARKED